MTLREIQEDQKAWALHNFGNVPWTDPFMGLVEELGELAHSLLKQKQGIRGLHAEHEEKAKDAVGDYLVYLLDLCTRRGWDAQQILEDTWREVRKRDWKKFPKNGLTE